MDGLLDFLGEHFGLIAAVTWFAIFLYFANGFITSILPA
jgi:hypothetical protein